MKIITANVNGIRSAANKGFFEWLSLQEADVICLQEIRADMDSLLEEIYRPTGYHSYFCMAEKKGYSGVGIYSKRKPDQVIKTLGWDVADKEGRYLQADFGNLSIGSLYMPSGSSSEDRQVIKMDFLERYTQVLKKIKESKREFIITGDWNIAHTKNDIKNWRSNQKSSGFLPEERAWLDLVFGELEFVDAFRQLEQEPDQYTWWSNRMRAWEKNVGWRIDYQITTPHFKGKVKSTEIYRGQKFSDHAPFTVTYDWEL
ncbi:MAG TPA: exodeoxyribonuclease III [Coxiellaceae bacterium]|nr:exodeoxyribonuclease III [Coxiellaceae bacterium]